MSEQSGLYMNIGEGKQINQKYTSDICKYVSTFVLVNTDQTLNWLEILEMFKLLFNLLLYTQSIVCATI